MVDLKETMKAWLPPALHDVLVGKRGKPSPTWDAARARAGVYEADLVNRFRVERSRLRSADGTMLRGSVLGLVARLFPSRPLVVTDFGGATGDLGLEFLDAFPGSTYHVVENGTLVAMMRDASEVNFTTEVPGSCDIFFTSGTLQYVDEPMEVLRRGFDSASSAVILTRNSFSETEKFRVQQSWLFENGTGPIPEGFANRRISYPHRTIRESEVLAIAGSADWECVARLEETGSSRGAYAKQLVFLRK
jgi:putative methyltransferase (TIGR04325 family)